MKRLHSASEEVNSRSNFPAPPARKTTVGSFDDVKKRLVSSTAVSKQLIFDPSVLFVPNLPQTCRFYSFKLNVAPLNEIKVSITPSTNYISINGAEHLEITLNLSNWNELHWIRVQSNDIRSNDTYRDQSHLIRHTLTSSDEVLINSKSSQDLRIVVFNQVGAKLFTTKKDDVVKDSLENGFRATEIEYKHNAIIMSPVPPKALQKRKSKKKSVLLVAKNGTTAPILNKTYPKIKQISTGRDFYAFIDTRSELYMCGSNNKGQLGNNFGLFESKPIKMILVDNKQVFHECITQVTCGSNFTAIITLNGQIVMWGDNDYGELGQGHRGKVKKPSLVEIEGESNTYSKSISISAGERHMLALFEDGSLFSWGDHLYGALGYSYNNDNNINTCLPKKVNMKDVTTINCGSFHSAVIDCDGKVYTCGLYDCGRLGRVHKNHVNGYDCKFAQVTGVIETERIIQLACGGSHTLVLSNNEEVFSWGNNDHGQLGLDDTISRKSPAKVIFFSAQILEPFQMNKKCISLIGAGENHSIAIERDPKHVYTWGCNDNGELSVNCQFKANYLPKLVSSFIGSRVLNCVGSSNATLFCIKDEKEDENINLHRHTALFEDPFQVDKSKEKILKEEELFASKIREIIDMKRRENLIQKISLLSRTQKLTSKVIENQLLVQKKIKEMEKKKFYIHPSHPFNPANSKSNDQSMMLKRNMKRFNPTDDDIERKATIVFKMLEANEMDDKYSQETSKNQFFLPVKNNYSREKEKQIENHEKNNSFSWVNKESDELMKSSPNKDILCARPKKKTWLNSSSNSKCNQKK